MTRASSELAHLSIAESIAAEIVTAGHSIGEVTATVTGSKSLTAS